MHYLSENIMDFLYDKGWELVKETQDYYYLSPPDDISTSKSYRFKLIKENNTVDYKFLIDATLDNLVEIYGNAYKKTLDKFRKDNIHSRRKHLDKKQWIIPEEESKGIKIEIYDIFIPES